MSDQPAYRRERGLLRELDRLAVRRATPRCLAALTP